MAHQHEPTTLRDSSPPKLVATLEQRMHGLLELPETELPTSLEGWIRDEYSLDDRALEAFTLARLRALLAIAAKNPSSALRIASAYDAAFARQPAGTAMRRATVVQTVARRSLRSDEIEQLQALIPSILQQVPRPASLRSAAEYRSDARVRRGRGRRAIRRFAGRLIAPLRQLRSRRVGG